MGERTAKNSSLANRSHHSRSRGGQAGGTSGDAFARCKGAGEERWVSRRLGCAREIAALPLSEPAGRDAAVVSRPRTRDYAAEHVCGALWKLLCARQLCRCLELAQRQIRSSSHAVRSVFRRGGATLLSGVARSGVALVAR